MTVIEELQQAATDVRDHVIPATVRIGRGWGRGSGFVLGKGLVATNAHNLRGEETTVTFADGRAATASVAGIDPDGDVVVLTVDTGDAPPLTWVDDAGAASVGTPVWTATLPAGSEGRVTFGIVSAVNRPFQGPGGRSIRGGVEHTAPLARGSSGGPVVDAGGRLVGINTHRMGEGFYLALSADDGLRRRLDALASGQSTRRPHLGVALAPAHAARRLRDAVGLAPRDGLLVRSVEESSPAQRAGVQRGDLIVGAGDRPVSEADDLYAALAAVGDDGSLLLIIVRGADELRLSVSFSAAEDEASPGD